MIAIGKILSAAIRGDFRLIQQEVFGKSARDAYEVASWGVDSVPVKGVDAAYCATNSINQPIVIGYVQKNRIAQVGEFRAYSTDTSGAFKFNVWVRADGTVLIGDSNSPSAYTDFLVKFNALKSGYDLLRTDLNNFVTIFNAHVHSGVTTGPGASGPTPTPGTPSSASIDSSKATKIKTN
jgi:hypothetical protein